VFDCVRTADVGRADAPVWAVKIVWQRGAHDREDVRKFWERECLLPLHHQVAIRAMPESEHIIRLEAAYRRTSGGLVRLVGGGGNNQSWDHPLLLCVDTPRTCMHTPPTQATIFCVMERSPCARAFGIDVTDRAELEPTRAAIARAIPEGGGGRGSGSDLTDSTVTPLPLHPKAASLVLGQLLKALKALHSQGLVHRVSASGRVGGSYSRHSIACGAGWPLHRRRT